MIDQENSDVPARIKSLSTTFKLIETLEDLGEAQLTEIADHSDIAKSTAHKHLNTMVDHDYIVKEESKYRLGFRFLDIGGHVRSQFPGVNIIKPKLQELAEKTNEVTQFMTEESGLAVVLYRESGRHGVPSRTRTGTRMYLHQTASGKAILSQLPPKRVNEIIDRHGLPAANDMTITDRDTLFEELEEIRDRGYSFSLGESTKGLFAVSAPMKAPDDTVIGACTVSGPSHRMRGKPIKEEMPHLILSVVNEIELTIAHS
ncbi:IclR family transcriptional regulator [Halegenticoccus tardaugens]|uniref:IclR family transcriptional regulator n=1 Tax=Halegenticoccus tardaugens TaxID=2071624 RepID=UPI00100BEEEF|nr:IclR family transcriptional regulator [Halegenticoccus tardaugens]